MAITRVKNGKLMKFDAGFVPRQYRGKYAVCAWGNADDGYSYGIRRLPHAEGFFYIMEIGDSIADMRKAASDRGFNLDNKVVVGARNFI
jgi:hypothetical protein